MVSPRMCLSTVRNHAVSMIRVFSWLCSLYRYVPRTLDLSSSFQLPVAVDDNNGSFVYGINQPCHKAGQLILSIRDSLAVVQKWEIVVVGARKQSRDQRPLTHSKAR
jgi:hypothetical protein